jgi:hypothetical protein
VRNATSRRSPAVRAALLTVIGAIASLAFAAPAAAQDAGTTTRQEQVVLTGRLLVEADEAVEAAVIFNGPATVEGTVRESLVVFNGRTVVSGTVGGDVVVFNGAVTVRSGATIEGNLVTGDAPDVESGATVVGEQRRVSADFDATQFGFASRVVWWIGYSVSTLLLGLALLALAPGIDLAIASAVRTRLGASFGFGAAAFFLLPVVAVLLLVIVVAIPLGVFLLLAFALLYTAGYVAGAHALGRRIVASPKSRFVAFLAGWAILRAVALVPFLGGLAWLLATLLGLGVLWVAARGSAPPSPAPDAPAPPPMPVPAS